MSPLKFFRQYEKWLVSIGMTLLMVLFLIEPAMMRFQPKADDIEIGKTRTRKVTTGDQRRANLEVELLPRISPMLGTGLERKSDALTWALMLQDAQDIGLSASDGEVELMLPIFGFKGGLNDPDLARVAMSQGLRADDIITALRHWLIIQSYRELHLGLGHVSTSQRAQVMGEVAQYMKPEYMQNPMLRNYLMQQVMGMLQTAQGTPRLSEPLVKRFLYDVRSQLKITALPISAERYVGTVGPVDEKTLVDLFEKYKTQFAGSSDPYGFGYKLPAWVRLEYLAFPFDRLLAKVSVEEADALAYYDGHLDQFTVTPPAPTTAPASTTQASSQPATAPASQPAPKPRQQTYDEVRKQILTGLRNQKAVQLGEAINKTSAALFGQEERVLPDDAGYRNIPAEYKPLPLTVVAEKIQKQYGVRADFVRIDDKNLDREALAKIPGLGQAIIGQDVPFVTYVMSARELATSETPLTTLRLQKGIVSQPLMGVDRSLYLFRLIDAQPVRVPATLAEVRPAVERDAKLLAAYRTLLEGKQTWANRLNKEGLDEIAKQISVKPITPPPFGRREIGRGTLDAPLLAGIGRSQAFVDEIFTIALQASQTAAMQPGKPQDRLAVISLDRSLSLYLVHIEQFKPMTQGQFDTTMTSYNMIAPQIQHAVVPMTKINPFATQAVEERVGFVPMAGRKKSGSQPSESPDTMETGDSAQPMESSVPVPMTDDAP